MGLPPGTGSRAVCGGEETGETRTGGGVEEDGRAAPPDPRIVRFRTSSGPESAQNLTILAGAGPAGVGQPGGRYLMPVVAKPLTRNRWPNRNTRNSGISETTDIANIAPQSEEPWVSRNDFSASGTVKFSGVVR